MLRRVQQLPSDYLPVTITIHTPIDLNANKNKIFTNHKKAMWDNFSELLELLFSVVHNDNNITNIDIHIKQFNRIITTTAATEYIPKGISKNTTPSTHQKSHTSSNDETSQNKTHQHPRHQT